MRAALALALLAACGGSSEVPDAAIDAHADAGPDAAPDAPRPAENCANGIDDNGDGNIDCADPSCTATAHCAVMTAQIQDVQDGTIATGTRVALAKVFVTAVRHPTSGALIAFIQEPDGVTAGTHVYPAYAGMQLFASTADVTMYGLQTLAVGDCISITGTVIEFQADTELLSPTAFVLEPAGTCGTMPAPFAAPFAAIATDTDLATMGDQPGASAEAYEGVLVTVTNVVALTAPDTQSHTFQVTQAGGAALVVGNFVYTDSGGLQATTGQSFTSITGTFAQRFRYELLPRTSADLQP